MKQRILFLSLIFLFFNCFSMERPQRIEAESLIIKTGVKRSAEKPIAPAGQKATRLETQIPGSVPMEVTAEGYSIGSLPHQTQSPLFAPQQPRHIPALYPREIPQPLYYQQQRMAPMSLQERIARIKIARQRAGLSAAQQLPRDYYYDEENIEKLAAQKKQLHAPCFIILDPEDDDKSLAMADSLKSALSRTEIVIVASTAVFYRLLEAYEKVDEKSDQFKYLTLRSDALLYQSPESNFVIFIPQDLLKSYQENSISLGINFEKLKNLSSFLDVDYELDKKKYVNLKDQLKNYPNKDTFNFQSFFRDFSTIFATKQNTNPEKLLIWDFIITGHGHTNPPYIASIPIKEFNQLLTFFDKNLLVGTIIVDTCMAGGTNLNLLEYEEWGIEKSHPYIFIITATTDSPVHGQYAGKYNSALSLAAWISDKGISLDRLLHFIPNISLDLSNKEAKQVKSIPNNTLSLLVRESLAIPQVWLPNGLGFQTYNIDQYVLVINNVMAHVAFENRKPIVIENKRVALLYPSHIKAPIIVTTWKQHHANPKEMNLPLAKTIIWHDMPMISESSFWNDISKDKQFEIRRIIAAEYPFMKFETPALSYIFPQFISMLRGDSTQLIDGVILAIDPSQGIMRFIRDAFLDKVERTSQKTFLIENLQGYNDILHLIHLSRIAKGISDIHPLEKLLANKKNQAISLKNVLISTRFDPDNNKEIITVAFAFEDTVWRFTYDDIKKLWPQTFSWNFTQIDPVPYNKAVSAIKEYYKSFETGQKTISETIQKKILKMQESKAK
jgi:hypothetical protein